MMDDMDLTMYISDFDNASEKTKEEYRQITNDEIINAYKLWKHVNGKGMLEFFKFIAEAEGFLTSPNYSVMPNIQVEGFTAIDKTFRNVDVTEWLYQDDEELERVLQNFNEFGCCGDEIHIDPDTNKAICSNCGKVIDPFDKKQEE